MSTIEPPPVHRIDADDDLPFSNYFFADLLPGTRSQPNKILLDWVQQPRLIAILKAWKNEELDDIYTYAKLVELIGFDLNREKWRRIVDQVVKRMIKSPQTPKARGSTLSQYQLMKVEATFLKSWGQVVGQIMKAAKIPGDDSSDTATNGMIIHKLAYSLLLTALMDLQDNPGGFFQCLLGGPVVPRPSADGKIEIPKIGLRGFSKHKIINKKEAPSQPRVSFSTPSRKRSAPMYHSDDDEDSLLPANKSVKESHLGKETTTYIPVAARYTESAHASSEEVDIITTKVHLSEECDAAGIVIRGEEMEEANGLKNRISA